MLRSTCETQRIARFQRSARPALIISRRCRTPCSVSPLSTASHPHHTDSISQSLFDWAQGRHTTSAPVGSIAIFDAGDGRGRRLVAVQAVPPGEVLLSVPFHRLFMSQVSAPPLLLQNVLHFRLPHSYPCIPSRALVHRHHHRISLASRCIELAASLQCAHTQSVQAILGAWTHVDADLDHLGSAQQS